MGVCCKLIVRSVAQKYQKFNAASACQIFGEGEEMKEFQYNRSHLDLLHKYRITRLLFMTLFCFVIIFQSVSWLVVWMGDIEVSVTDMVFVGVTLGLSLVEFICHAWLYAYNNRVIAEVEQNGSATGYVSRLAVNESSTLANALLVFCRVITVLFTIFVGICIFNFVDNVLNWGRILLKIPALVLVVVGFLNLSGTLRYNKLLSVKK